jgi:hypothetical protein
MGANCAKLKQLEKISYDEVQIILDSFRFLEPNGSKCMKQAKEDDHELSLKRNNLNQRVCLAKLDCS